MILCTLYDCIVVLKFTRQPVYSRFSRISYTELEEALASYRIAPEWEYENLGKIISSFLQHEKEDARNVFIRKYFFFDSISDVAEQYSLNLLRK